MTKNMASETNVIKLFRVVSYEYRNKVEHLLLAMKPTSGVIAIKLIISVADDEANKLECLYLALSSIVFCLWARPGAYLRVVMLAVVTSPSKQAYKSGSTEAIF